MKVFYWTGLLLTSLLIFACMAKKGSDKQSKEEERFDELFYEDTSQPPVTRLDDSEISSSALDSNIRFLMDAAEVTGLAISIFNDNQIVYKKAFGYANYQKKTLLQTGHIFYGASLSKAVFGYLAANLVNQGVLDLDTPLQNYLDVPIPDLQAEKEWRGFQDLKGDNRYEEITARMCLSHTSGFPNWRWLTRVGEFDRDGKLSFFFDPGSQYSYSGEGMMLLQYVAEHLTGRGLEDLAQEIVFAPLEMNNTSYVWQERFEGNFCNGHTTEQELIKKDREDDAGAAGSMETTLEDYSKFVRHILTLSSNHSEITNLMFHPNIKIQTKAQFGPLSLEKSTENDDIELSYGLGWGLLRLPYGLGAFKEGHGEGFQHYSIIFPQKKMGVIILSNSDHAESIFKELLEISIGDKYTPWKWENYIPYDM